MNEIELDELTRRLADETLTILDVRHATEFDGSNGKPCDLRQGHIPGARHLDVYNLVGLSTEALREQLGLAEGAEIAVYCHGGTRSALAAAMLRDAGYEARNYVGSWHEWSRRDDLPIE